MCVQGDFQIGRVIGTVKYANDLVLLTKDEAALLGMTDGLTGSGICYGMEMNVKKKLRQWESQGNYSHYRLC
jgi:hypothetical protein